MDPIRIALIGCGAIAQNGYLPALPFVPEVRCEWLVEAKKGLAETHALRWGIPHVTEDYELALEAVEAVILTVPNDLHAPMTLEALRRKRAVLCEKPLAISKREAIEMVDSSRRAGVALVAGMTMRQFPGLQAVRHRFPWAVLGRIREIRASFGFPLDWPLATPYLFERNRVGGGVLIAEAIHLVDALFWVLCAERISVENYVDDGESGVESEGRARLRVELPDRRGAVGCTLQVSRVRRLGNSIEVVGDRAMLRIPLSPIDLPLLQTGDTVRAAVDTEEIPHNSPPVFVRQLKSFAEKVRGAAGDCADGESQIQVLELIEECYRVRKPLSFSWQDYRPWEGSHLQGSHAAP
jgi:UDP-N-acetylglucosamine 3-dehydrogenase